MVTPQFYAWAVFMGIMMTVMSPVVSASPPQAVFQPFKPIDRQSGVALKPARVVLPQWQFKPGFYNAITDVPGVAVGHTTLQADTPQPIRTGVTAIFPQKANMANTAYAASATVLNGNGEMTGLGPVMKDGVLNSPIVLTNTFAVSDGIEGVFRYFQGQQWLGQLPVVGECYDGFFNTIEDLDAVRPEHVTAALQAAHGGWVPQGRVGAGTGMRSFGMHAGIGSASRQLVVDGKTYTIGVLVNANHGRLPQMNPQVRQALAERLGPLDVVAAEDARDARNQSAQPTPQLPRQGSIITVIATDLPLNATALKKLSERAALGLGNMGSTQDPSSGDFALAFSTANPFPVPPQQPFIPQNTLHPDLLAPVCRATVEAVTEAQINALLAAHPPQGVRN
jgi:D-aminopeptidase